MKTTHAVASSALYTLYALAQEGAGSCNEFRVTHVSQDIPCATVGVLYVDPEVSGTLELDGVVAVRGFSMVDNKGLVNLSSTSLSRIESYFEVRRATSLRTIQLPNLTEISMFTAVDAPELDSIILGGETGLTAGELQVINTPVTKLDFFPDSVLSVRLINNTRLGEFYSGIQNIGYGTFNFNSRKFVVSLPNVVSAVELNIGQTTRINLKSLVSVNSSLALTDNNLLASEGISVSHRTDKPTPLEFPQLKTVGDSLSIANNSNILNIEFPQLQTVGVSLSIVNNSAAEKINFPQLNQIGGNLTVVNDLANVELDGFPSLTNVSGKVIFGGNFKFLELPSLSNAYDGLWVSSSENISLNCAALEKSFQSSRPHQSFECRSAGEVWTGNGDITREIDPASTDPGQTQDGEQTPSAQPLSGGAIAGIVISTLAAVGILAAVLFLLWRRHKKGTEGEGRTSTAGAGDLQDPKYTFVPPDELQGVPRSELAIPDPELEGSRWGTIYYEVDGTTRRGA